MANRSVFPGAVDSFSDMSDIQASELTEVNRIKDLKSKTTRTPAEDTELNNLLVKYQNKIFTAEKLNLIQDALYNSEVYFKNMEGTINTAKTDALTAIDNKLASVNTYLDGTTAGALRTDIGVMADLLTTAKGSLVAAVNELHGELPAPYVHPSSHEASMITLADAGSLITANNVENALQEIVTKINARQFNTGNFNGTTGTTISHTKGDTNYYVIVMPTANPNGYLGEYWIEKASTNFKVCCSGSATTSFLTIMFW